MADHFGRNTHGESRAIFAIGGQNNKAFLCLPATACTLISTETWPKLVDFLKNKLNGKITRWDGAADDYAGIHSVDWALDQFYKGEFSTGGNRPSSQIHGDWLDDGKKGRTLNIGNRKNGKLLRIYEKGKQLGDETSPWVRWELELHNNDRIIPWDVITNPGPYVAGAYAATSWIADKACRVKTSKLSSKITYEHLTQCLRDAYGPMLNVMLAREGSAEKVIEKVLRDGIPRRLQIPVPADLIAQQGDKGTQES